MSLSRLGVPVLCLVLTISPHADLAGRAGSVMGCRVLQDAPTEGVNLQGTVQYPSLATSVRESLLSWVSQRRRDSPTEVYLLLTQVRDPSARRVLLAKTFLDVAGQVSPVDAQDRLASELARVIASGEVDAQSIVSSDWTSLPTGARKMVAVALERLIPSTPSVAAPAAERATCLELNEVARLFVPGTARDVLQLSVDTEVLVLLVRVLREGGVQGVASLDSLVRITAPINGLNQYVRRVLHGLALEEQGQAVRELF